MSRPLKGANSGLVMTAKSLPRVGLPVNGAGTDGVPEIPRLSPPFSSSTMTYAKFMLRFGAKTDFVERPAKSPLAYVFLYVAMLANGCRPARAIVSIGMNGITLSLPVSGNSVYIHLISMMPVVSVFSPASDVVPGWAREQPMVVRLWFFEGPPPHEPFCP